MSSRLALESWQLLFPAIGIAIFAAIFFAVVFRVWRMKPPRVEHLGQLPLEAEESRSPARERRDRIANNLSNPDPRSSTTHGR